jgi:AbrB family looped-hinge helix DNA binding protein
MITTTVSSKGQVILPYEIRKENRIIKGTKLIIETDKNRIILTPINRDYFEKLSGSISSRKGKLLEALLREKYKEKKLPLIGYKDSRWMVI